MWYMIFGTANVLNSACFDLIFVAMGSHRRQPVKLFMESSAVSFRLIFH